MTDTERRELLQFTNKIEGIREQNIINKADVRQLELLKAMRAELLNQITSQWHW